MTIKRTLIILCIGIIFGFTLIKGEVVSWFRIQEMFRFEAFHMYGVIGTAVIVGAIGVFLLQKLGMKTIDGGDIEVEKRPFGKGHVIGGLIFGIGWAITGACPGPIFALMSAGYLSVALVFVGALLGTFIYGMLRDKLPQ